jgi:peroxiredoxin
VDGKRYSLSSFNDKKNLVVFFTSNGCPTAKACEGRIIRLQNEYRDRSVQFLAINSNNEHLSAIDSLQEMVQRADESRYNFPYLKDSERKAAESYGAICTPHFFVLDVDRRLRYRGRMDNSRVESRVTVSDLRNALEDLLSGRIVRVAETEPFGCGIVW